MAKNAENAHLVSLAVGAIRMTSSILMLMLQKSQVIFTVGSPQAIGPGAGDD